MAEPFGQNYDHSRLSEPQPEVREPTADGPLATQQPFKPWPTTVAPHAQADGEYPVAPPPTDDWEETARTQKQEIGIDPADFSPLSLGRRPLYKRSEPPPSADEQLENVIEFLQKLQQSVRNVAPEVDAPSPSALGSSLLQARRLSRTGVVPDHFEIGVLPKPPKPEPVPPPPAEVDSAPAVEATPESREIPLPPEPICLERSHVVWLVLTGGLCLATLGLVAYLWTRLDPLTHVNVAPRNPVARATSSPKPEPEISAEALSLADLALEAMQQGDFKRASDILTRAQKQGVILPGLSYQAALLAFNQGQAQEADQFLERSIAANEAVSDCWYLRANMIFYSEGPAQAAEAFEQAVAFAPFHPRYYFFRAECLRRNGNAVAAVEQFQRALRCRPNSADTELILFKIGLTKIETNSDLISKAELHDRLAQEPVSGDTLLLAAADAISRSEFPAAADFLKRAALSLPPRVFQSRLRDYVFQTQVKQPDIAAALKVTLSAAPTSHQPVQRTGRVLVDPATRSLAEADPAGW